MFHLTLKKRLYMLTIIRKYCPVVFFWEMMKRSMNLKNHCVWNILYQEGIYQKVVFWFWFFDVLYCNHVAFYPSKDIKHVDNVQKIYSDRGQLMRLRDLKFGKQMEIYPSIICYMYIKGQKTLPRIEFHQKTVCLYSKIVLGNRPISKWHCFDVKLDFLPL